MSDQNLSIFISYKKDATKVQRNDSAIFSNPAQIV